MTKEYAMAKAIKAIEQIENGLKDVLTESEADGAVFIMLEHKEALDLLTAAELVREALKGK